MTDIIDRAALAITDCEAAGSITLSQARVVALAVFEAAREGPSLEDFKRRPGTANSDINAIRGDPKITERHRSIWRDWIDCALGRPMS